MKALFAGIVEGDVVRYEMPSVGALNFVMHRALGGGVTRSLALDAHGKCLSSAAARPRGLKASSDATRRKIRQCLSYTPR